MKNQVKKMVSKKMKIVAINASPHKGNTLSVLNEIKETYKEIDFKILSLNRLNFQMCKGCYSCVRFGADKCPISHLK